MGETGRPAQVRLDMQHLFLGLERHIFNLDRDVIDLELLRQKVPRLAQHAGGVTCLRHHEVTAHRVETRGDGPNM